jgi:hypothetical protein
VNVIEEGNTNDVLKSLWPTMKKKGKDVKIFEDYEVFILFEPQELRIIKGDALGELVKCKSSKSISKPKISEKSDISGFLARFQKVLPDMSAPNPDMSRFLLILRLTQLSRTYPNSSNPC